MPCPRCRDSFVDGRTHVCPDDGPQFVAQGIVTHEQGKIFANLTPRMDAHSEINKPGQPVHNAHRDVGKTDVVSPGSSDIFFEIDDANDEGGDGVLGSISVGEPADRPVGRKVHPTEIPKGHADLGDLDRYTGPASDFDEREPESFVGKVVKGRYRVTEFLGGDEDGLAYLADDKLVDDKKVLVRILIGTRSDEIMNSILSEERVSLSHFSHPNIARLIDSGQFTNGPHFLVSEYIDALSAAEILHIHGHLDHLRAARIIRQAANALNGAHQAGILHRDIRPQNLIVNVVEGEPEQTKLVNFGASTGEPNQLNIGYKSPELLDGRIATIGSDIHSLAVVAYQLLTGRLPFAGSSAKEISRAQKAGLKVHPTNIRPELPLSVDHVFDKAFSNNAVDRYPGARDFGDALSNALTGIQARSSSTKPTLGESAQNKPLRADPPVQSSDNLSYSPFDSVVETDKPLIVADQPSWLNDSFEPLKQETSRTRVFVALGAVALLAAIGAIWYYLAADPRAPRTPVEEGTSESSRVTSPPPANPVLAVRTRNVLPPPDTNFYENNKQNLKGDLAGNFVGFTLYYPKHWRLNGPQEGNGNLRGKFLDITSETKEGKLKEQMLISYYPSNGSYSEDLVKFPQLVRETNDTLANLLPDYKVVSQGETRVNGELPAYEIRFVGGGTSRAGENLTVWGRRLYVPATQPGSQNGFEITLLATSLADGVTDVNEVGVKGELATILYTFEPSREL